MLPHHVLALWNRCEFCHITPNATERDMILHSHPAATPITPTPSSLELDGAARSPGESGSAVLELAGLCWFFDADLRSLRVTRLSLCPPVFLRSRPKMNPTRFPVAAFSLGRSPHRRAAARRSPATHHPRRPSALACPGYGSPGVCPAAVDRGAPARHPTVLPFQPSTSGIPPHSRHAPSTAISSFSDSGGARIQDHCPATGAPTRFHESQQSADCGPEPCPWSQDSCPQDPCRFSVDASPATAPDPWCTRTVSAGWTASPAKPTDDASHGRFTAGWRCPPPMLHFLTERFCRSPVWLPTP